MSLWFVVGCFLASGGGRPEATTRGAPRRRCINFFALPIRCTRHGCPAAGFFATVSGFISGGLLCLIVLDNCSTDCTEEIVRNFTAITCEFIRNASNLGLFGNLNRCLEFAAETEFLHILHADDLIEPEFYATTTKLLAAAAGRGMVWCRDERIDQNNSH